MKFAFSNQNQPNSVSESLKFIEDNFSDPEKSTEVITQLRYINRKFYGKSVSLPGHTYLTGNLLYHMRSDHRERIENMIKPIIEHLKETIIIPELDPDLKAPESYLNSSALILFYQLLHQSELEDPRLTYYSNDHPLPDKGPVSAIILEDKSIIDVYNAYGSKEITFRNDEHGLFLSSSQEKHKTAFKKWAQKSLKTLEAQEGLLLDAQRFYPNEIQTSLKKFQNGRKKFLTSLINYCENGE